MYFTPVCTTEIIAFSKMYQEFKKNNTKLLGLSVDSNPSHLAWIHDIYQKTKIEVPFPIIADLNGEIARKYGMISSQESTTQTIRNVFVIDPESKVRLIHIYPMNVGRNIPEILRAVQALQIVTEMEVSTPANWVPDQPLIQKSPQTQKELKEKEEQILDEKNGMSWYLSFQKAKKKEL